MTVSGAVYAGAAPADPFCRFPAAMTPPPPGRKERPAMPPSPTASVTPVQNATSSKLDVGLSRGPFEGTSPQLRRQDVAVSSGLGRVHRTQPITATVRPRRPSESAVRAAAPNVPAPETPPTPPASRTSRSRMLLWLGLLLAIMVPAVLGAMIVYYLYLYPNF